MSALPRQSLPLKEPSVLQPASTRELQQNIIVAVRVRPLLPQEANFDKCVSVNPDHQLLVNYRDTLVKARVHHCFDENSLQSDVADYFLPWVERFLSYQPCCILAYGHTGSGKTYSMYGEENNQSKKKNNQRREETLLNSGLEANNSPGQHVRGSSR